MKFIIIKLITIALFILTSANCFAKIEKSCQSKVNLDGKKETYLFTVFQNSGKRYGTVVTKKGDTFLYNIVTKKSYKVAKGLNSSILETNPYIKLNEGENIVVQSLFLQDMLGLSAGFDIYKIRNLVVYEFVEKQSTLGKTILSEAKDEKGTYLGSFISGFFLAPCL